MGASDLPPDSTLRRRAFEKLGRLTATSAHPKQTKAGRDGFLQLCQQCRGPATSKLQLNGDAPDRHVRPPMSTRELEILLSLCHAAGAIQQLEHAQALVQRIGPYLVEVHELSFQQSPFLKTFRPSSWELISRDVTLALLQIGLKFESLRTQALGHLKRAVDAWLIAGQQIANAQPESPLQTPQEHVSEAEAETVRLCVALIGLLEAVAELPHALKPSERFSLMQELHSILGQEFMIRVEARLSSIRNSSSHYKDVRPWKRVLTAYASAGRPLGAMLLQHSFMRLLASATSLFVAMADRIDSRGTLDVLLDCDTPYQTFPSDIAEGTIERLADYVVDAIGLVEDDADYLQVSSVWQQRLSHSMKAYSFRAFLYLSLLKDTADADVLMGWLEAVLADPVQLADEELAQTSLKCLAILAKTSRAFASALGRSLPRLIVQSKMTSETATVASECLARVLLLLPQDMQISTLYSLGNILSVGTDPARINPTLFFDDPSVANGKLDSNFYSQETQGSSISVATSDVDEMATVHGTVVQAIVSIAIRSVDEKIISLVVSMLIQKMGRVSTAIDVKILTGTAYLACSGSVNDLRLLLRVCTRVTHQSIRLGNDILLRSCTEARLILSREILTSSPLFEVYLANLLDSIVSISGAVQSDQAATKDGVPGAEEIGYLLEPLAVLVSKERIPFESLEEPQLLRNLGRNSWYNLVAHDFTLNSNLTKKHAGALQLLAMHSTPIVDEDRAVGGRESNLELNTVLRRNMNPSHTTQQKQALIQCFPTLVDDIESLDYAQLTFLNAAHLIAVFRARGGSCTRTMEYFSDRKFLSGPFSKVLMEIAKIEVEVFLQGTKSEQSQRFAAPALAQQLVIFLQGCCHRMARVQHVAIASADLIISQIPSALCQGSALFAMLELLTLMWNSCLEEETEDVEWRHEYTSKRGGVSIQLSDDFQMRRSTLASFQKYCTKWVTQVMKEMPLDMKGLLQTYLSDFEDQGAYGHVALGRSFALEMGCAIPSEDLRIGTMDKRLEIGINSASDFVAQYTTRQEYRTIDSMFDEDHEAVLSRSRLTYISHAELAREVQEATTELKALHDMVNDGETVSIAELRPVLRRAAALLCRSDVDNRALVQLLVKVPCLIFSRESVKLGVSLWMGVLCENNKLESQILFEVLQNCEDRYRKGETIFNAPIKHPDPFYVKQEFAPTDKDAMTRRRDRAGEFISPTLRLFQFVASQYHAKRFTTTSLEKFYTRLTWVTSLAMQHGQEQPLAREVHLRIVTSALRVLSLGPSKDEERQWLAKDQFLSMGLKWFEMAPKWSYGGNKLQLKVDLNAISDLLAILQATASIGAQATRTRRSLQPKTHLLIVLLQDEAQRLNVWLSPLDAERHRGLHLHSHHDKPPESVVTALVPTAWAESGKLAVQIAARFHYPGVISAVRDLLVKSPEKALDEPEAVMILLGVSGSQPTAEQLQLQSLTTRRSATIEPQYLRYLLYWAAVNPVTAVTYFLPAYGGHPFVVQYALRALESHSVDITFFYVPQIVQTLRHDNQGYVERYIIETAKFSQLFAHQIIWNMKANAFKDEDSEVPDAIKPTLDKVMSALIDSFSAQDKDFYEKEFAFFNEVTGISGKLRPFIKRPKPEKKQKIEEELRKIQVTVGVYLPSNPDGVVIGIDRQSGKPLQSHAKAPFMATFRIRKELKAEDDATGQTKVLHQRNTSVETTRGNHAHVVDRRDPIHYEVWQSAIFKVGDDCRQDVLALQLISTFRSIFNNVGLDVYVFPYRVTATAPGCGVIDVLPNSISRDMLGREQVNGLYEYFLSHFGSEDSLAFQRARANFIKSMAAYSVISYLLQFKDRHNGNIMIDDQGHVLHIDFGFLFDIAPGGVRFERAPFKLTSEMVAVMGGSASSAPYLRFEELCVKAFLAARPYADKLASLVTPMLESGLPCFKPETIKHLRERFVLDRSEREAAEFMRMLVRRSEGSYSTKGYDQFQLLTNGIPY